MISARRNVMRKNSGMLWTLFMGISVLLTALFYAGCEDIMPAEGEFENQTSHSITVTIVGSDFSIKRGDSKEFAPSTSTSIYLYSDENVRIQSKDNEINFKWTASSGDANRKIYVVNDGDKVTFKE
jgi:hypothetical protein